MGAGLLEDIILVSNIVMENRTIKNCQFNGHLIFLELSLDVNCGNLTDVIGKNESLFIVSFWPEIQDVDRKNVTD